MSLAQVELSPALLTGDFEAGDLDALIIANANEPKIAFDLLAVKAQSLVGDGAFGQAAEITLTMAAYAQRFPERLDVDVPSLYWDAASLYMQGQDLESARQAYYAALTSLRERAPGPELLSALLEEIADLEDALGEDEVARSLREQAADAPEAADTPPATRSNDPGFVTIPVHYATDRARTGQGRPARFYGADRATQLDLGIAEVTIPRTHIPGTISAPTIFKLEFSEDPARHVVLQTITPIESAPFFASIREGLAQRSAGDLFVFVHGYNVTFDSAAKRAAQLAYDMDFKGLPVLYSWPSKGATVGYIADSAVVRLSGRRLMLFLEDLVAQSGARTIHIIAHSMGNRAVMDALELIALRNAPIDAPLFDQIIFAAPDVDQGLFAHILPTIRPLAERLTLYASNKDWALVASRKLHGNAPRAGQGGEDLIEIPVIDTIDMSELGEDMLAHSYVANDQSAILDIATLFWRNPAPNQRCGMEANPSLERVWQYVRSECAGQSMLNIVGHLRNTGAISKQQVRAVLTHDFAGEPGIAAFENILIDAAAD
ncbi:MAG: alpha/beta hydrolase [Pelagibaca sp.]